MEPNARGQSGLDRLLVFVVLTIAVVAVLPTILGFAGVDVRPSASGNATTTTPTPEPASLQVLNVSGTAGGDENRSVGVVRVTVTKVGSDASVDLSRATVTWADERVYFLSPRATQREDADGEFGLVVEHVGPETGTVLGETGDRGTLTFDIGADDVAGVGEFGEELREGERAELIVTTADGRTATVTVAVPDSLDGKTVVGL